MPSIVIVVVHPSRIVREGLASILGKSPFAPACTASSIEDVPTTIASAGEQMLLLIGVREASELTDDMVAAKASFPNAHVVVFGDPRRCDLVITALTSGATTFVDENVATSALIKELDLIAQGEPVISLSIFKRLLRHSSAPHIEKAVVAPAVDQPKPPDTEGQPAQGLHFSGREAEILNSLVHGASNKVIGRQLKITEATVKVHVKALLRKIRAKNRTQAAIWALNRQLVPKNLHSANGELARTPKQLDDTRLEVGP
jgi:two-component system, NarL family, nitrate/nitrite response regulator NarL